MQTAESLIRRVRKTKHGFSDILQAAQEVFAGHSRAQSAQLAKVLFASDAPQARMLAAFLLGMLSAKSKASLQFLRRHVSRDVV